MTIFWILELSRRKTESQPKKKKKKENSLLRGTYYYQFPEGIYIQALNTEFKYITPSHFFRISTIYIPARA